MPSTVVAILALAFAAPPPPPDDLDPGSTSSITETKMLCGRYSVSISYRTDRDALGDSVFSMLSRLTKYQVLYNNQAIGDVDHLTLPSRYRLYGTYPRCEGKELLYVEFLLEDTEKGEFNFNQVVYDDGMFVHSGTSLVPQLDFLSGP